ncbi:transglutaminaseTgpA domain-containing protein [Amycolatopsis suaedae]|uniref:Transglutaminase domain-containing protein n=1 Tax=Amycolatopsis suaedae TaxID=2510978 RepID=A0A4Q7J3I8_9PSEU|nr:transglutaminase domain-containing protein [Amycolatopsis suaedae]RZQ61527.1 transglutaminase domain-containing protein [Amycolatopsis suaedae]
MISRSRVAQACVLALVLLGGLLFAPVFTFGALWLPAGLAVLVAFGVAELCRRLPGLVPWRSLLVLVAGLLAVAVAVVGVPTGQAFGVLADGVLHGWQLTLQSTWPARPEPRLLAFVPVAVVVAATIGLELLHRLRSPLPALLPGLAVIGLSQAYSALSAGPALAVALAVAAVAGLLLVDTGDHVGVRGQRIALLAAPAVALGVVGALAVGMADPLGRPAWSLKQDETAPLSAAAVANPLGEIASRLTRPDVEVFRYTSDARPAYWTVAVLDQFDGVSWTAGGSFRRVGAELPPGTGVTVPVQRRSAAVTTTGALDGPWLPSQPLPASVGGVDPLVDEARGTLVTAGPPARAASYTLSWWETEPARLSGAALDPHAPGGFGALGGVPPEIEKLAREAVGVRPSFEAALALERFFTDNYRLATGRDIPTGHAWPQLRRFLLETKQGTSEQFATGYVVLARLLGIPARVAVGYGAPPQPTPAGEFVVRNADVLAWPEVAVAGVGWVPLDPIGNAAAGSGTGGGLAEVTERARAQLPPPQELRDPPLPPAPPGAGEEPGGSWDWPLAAVVAGAVLAVVVLGWLLGVPLATAVRSWRRRRRGGAVAAWAEARDRLRAHGVPVTVGMTVRDLAAASAPLTNESTVDALRSLAVTVDAALWSGGSVPAGPAWQAVRAVRKGLSRRPAGARLRAAFNARALLPPRS